MRPVVQVRQVPQERAQVPSTAVTVAVAAQVKSSEPETRVVAPAETAATA